MPSGWVNIDGTTFGAAPDGPTGSVLFKKDATTPSGSGNFNYADASALLALTGTLEVIGDISASVNISASSFHGDGASLTGITTTTVLGPTGSVLFKETGTSTSGSGNFNYADASALLALTGTLEVIGSISASTGISASSFHGDGASLTGITAGVGGSSWDSDLPQDPGNVVYLEKTIVHASLKVSAAGVMVPTLGSSVSGTYFFDVLKEGTSVMTGSIDLETLVAGKWQTGSIKTDGTEDLAIGNKLRVHASSSNADLTGYTDGLMFTIGFTNQ